MRKILFTKLTGAGNDFILIDKNNDENLKLTPEIIKELCDRRFGIGADGILTIADAENYDFQMEYFNSDGTAGMLCGNGARCAIKYANKSGMITSEKTNFVCNDEKFSGEILGGDLVKFNLNPPTDLRQNIEIDVQGKKIIASFVNTGAHHVVIELGDQNSNDQIFNELNKFPVHEFGKEIRYSSDFAPLGTNVNFINTEKDKIVIRTYERGVEQETLACGTGSVAAAIISKINKDIKLPVDVLTKGGDSLTVDFFIEEGAISNVSLTGPAKIVFNGEFQFKNNEDING
ncbi:MAG: diaminopimelate epimerase [Melioribacteraceae bacterium]|nr:diaminopimelate epimerase [Melioribacteraceae bacterium]